MILLLTIWLIGLLKNITEFLVTSTILTKTTCSDLTRTPGLLSNTFLEEMVMTNNFMDKSPLVVEIMTGHGKRTTERESTARSTESIKEVANIDTLRAHVTARLNLTAILIALALGVSLLLLSQHADHRMMLRSSHLLFSNVITFPLLKIFLNPSTGLIKVLSLQLRTKDNVVHAGLSLLPDLWKVDIRSRLVTFQLFLSNNSLIAPRLKETWVAMVVSWTTPSSMLKPTRWKPNLSIPTRLPKVLAVPRVVILKLLTIRMFLKNLLKILRLLLLKVQFPLLLMHQVSHSNCITVVS